MSQGNEKVEWRVLQMADFVDGGPPDWRMLQNQGISIEDGRRVIRALSKRGHVILETASPPGTRGNKIMRVWLTDDGRERLDKHDANYGSSLS